MKHDKAIALIESHRTPRGGFTRACLADLGVPWPAPKRWRRRLIRQLTGNAVTMHKSPTIQAPKIQPPLF